MSWKYLQITATSCPTGFPNCHLATLISLGLYKLLIISSDSHSPRDLLQLKTEENCTFQLKISNLCCFPAGKTAKQTNLRREVFIRAGNNWNQAVATTETEMFCTWWMTTSQNHQLLSKSPRDLILCWNPYNSNKQTVLCSLLGPPAVPGVCAS